MQEKSTIYGNFSGYGEFAILRSVAQALAVAGICLALIGCDSGVPPTPTPGTGKQPFAGATLTLACPDLVLAKELLRQSSGWSARTGGIVKLTNDAVGDIQIVRPGAVGAMTVRDEFLSVSPAIQAADHPGQWTRTMSVYRERLCGWGGDVRAVPVAGEGYAVVYRADRFDDAATKAAYLTKYARPLVPPATWEEFADIAEFFADRFGTSLPMPNPEPALALREFHMIAACYDRPAFAISGMSKKGDPTQPTDSQILSFHYDVETGKPRLTAPSFLAAARWMKRMQRCRTPATEPGDALMKGSATLALMSLGELGRLPRTGGAAPENLSLTSLPGTRLFYDKVGAEKPPADLVRGVNFVPYFGGGGWVGGVRKGCTNPEAAFDFLAELAGPTRSADLLSDPEFGFGPFRNEHIEQSREAIWSRYGFDAERSKSLNDAIRQYAALSMANPVYAPRGPDQAEELADLAKEIARSSAGQITPEAALAAAQEAWLKRDATHPADTVKEWQRKAAGL